jgi:long-chain fatty acid transport protein
VGATGRIGERIHLDAALAYIDFAKSDVRHDTVFYAGTPAATLTSLRGSVQGTGYVMSLGLRTEF